MWPASSSGNFAAAGKLYTINTTTAVATLVGSTGDFFGSLAFAPNGVLYMASADLDNMGNVVNTELKTLNPATANTLSMVPTPEFDSSLGVRPTDGVIFGHDADGPVSLAPRVGGLFRTVGANPPHVPRAQPARPTNTPQLFVWIKNSAELR